MLRVCCCCRLRDLITRYAIAATSTTESLRDTEGILLAAENAEALAADMRDELRRVWGRAIRAEMVATVSVTACRRCFSLGWVAHTNDAALTCRTSLVAIM